MIFTLSFHQIHQSHPGESSSYDLYLECALDPNMNEYESQLTNLECSFDPNMNNKDRLVGQLTNLECALDPNMNDPNI